MLFALKSTFNVRETVSMYKAPKEQNNNYNAESCPEKNCFNLPFCQKINFLFWPASIILFRTYKKELDLLT